MTIFKTQKNDIISEEYSSDQISRILENTRTDLDVLDDLITTISAYLVPTGSIEMYGGSTAPTGWLICNGSAISRTTYADLFAIIGTTFGVGDGSTTFNIPDCRGIFVRGAGSNGTLNDANGSAFSGTLGTYQNDKLQGHIHQIYPNAMNSYASGIDYFSLRPSGGTQYTKYVGNPITDGANGTPRTGTETNPANLSLNYIIKT